MNGVIQLVIKVVSGPDAGKSFTVRDTCYMGTQEMCLVRLSDTSVAPLFARLTLRGDSFTITDLSDRPELKVNNRLAKSMKLFPGDSISAGGTVMKVEDPNSAMDRESSADLHNSPTDERIEFARPEIVGEEENVMPDFASRVTSDNASRPAVPPVEQLKQVKEIAREPGPSISGTPAVDALLRDTQRSSERAGKPSYLGIIVCLGIAGIIIALCLASLISSRRLADRDFNEVTKFARENPGEIRQIIEKYTKVRNEAGWASPKIRGYLSSEIARLMADVAAKEEDLKVTLGQLDLRVSQLTEKQAYEEALAVYRKVDEKYRARVMELRKSAIEDLVRQAEGHATKIKEQQQEEQQQIQVANEKRMKEKLDMVLNDVARLLVEGDSREAIRLLEGVLADGTYSSVRSGVEDALTTVKLLNAIDRMQSLNAGRAGSGEVAAGSTNASQADFQEKLSPVLKAVFAIRKDDVWEARAQLEKAKDHFLYSVLMGRLQMTDEDWKLEKEAVRSFSVIWSAVTGKPVTTIPVADDCVTQWGEASRGMGQEVRVKLSGEIAAFKKKYFKTSFARKYEKLFGSVNSGLNEAPAPVNAVTAAPSLSGVGDAKIIQADGHVFYVEADEGIPEGVGNNVGLFTEKTVFKAPGTNKAVAVRVDIHAVVPFRVLGKKQASFSLPDGMKFDPPAVGERVLMRKDLQVGARIISMVDKPVLQKLFEDAFELEKIGPLWVHPPGEVKLERERLCIDRSEGLPVEWKKGEQKLDLKLMRDLGSDPLKVEFDYLRKADGGVCVGIGDLEFLTATVDGRKSGIYVKGVLVKPAVFPKPSSKDPQRILIIKAQTFGYMAVGKSTAGCRISVNAGESPVKHIQLSSEGKMWIDNFAVSRLQGSGCAEIAAVSTEGKEILVSKGSELEWENIQKLHQIYVFGPLDNSRQKPLALGRVEGFVPGDRLLCSVIEGKVSGVHETVWLSSDISVAQEEGMIAAGDRNKAQEVHLPGTFYGVVEQGKAGTFAVVPDVRETAMLREGFFGLVDKLVVHSETGEKLAAWVGKEIRCEVTKAAPAGSRISCKPPDGYPVSGIINSGVLLSRQLLAGSDRVDLAGKMIPASISVLTGRQPFWIAVNGDWKEKPDGITGSSNPKSRVPPVLLCSEVFEGNVQYDLSMRVEDAGAIPKDDWMKDVMIQLEFPEKRKCVTFAIGAGTAGGVLVHCDTIKVQKGEDNLVKAGEDISFGRSGEFGTNTEVRVEKAADSNQPSLALGRNYELRVRRVGAVASFYVNGKRLGYVRCPEFAGKVRLMLAAPSRNVTVGRVSAREISMSCVTPAKEPVLGEFGYVQWVDADGILVDSAMNGAALNDTVSIVTIDKVVEGEKSKTVFMKRVALGTIKEIGAMTALIGRTDSGEPVKKGMKVLRGTRPLSFLFTDARIGSIDEGL